MYRTDAQIAISSGQTYIQFPQLILVLVIILILHCTQVVEATFVPVYLSKLLLQLQTKRDQIALLQPLWYIIFSSIIFSTSNKYSFTVLKKA
jgi:hypothetical protein